jgi:hypothetical protein
LSAKIREASPSVIGINDLWDTNELRRVSLANCHFFSATKLMESLMECDRICSGDSQKLVEKILIWGKTLTNFKKEPEKLACISLNISRTGTLYVHCII